MKPVSRSTSPAIRVLLVVVLVVASSPAEQVFEEQAHGFDGAGRLNVERESEATDTVGGETRWGATTTGSRWHAAERAQHDAAAGGNGRDGQKWMRLRDDVSQQEPATTRSSDVDRIKGDRELHMPSGSRTPSTQQPADDGSPEVPPSRALVEAHTEGAAMPMAAPLPSTTSVFSSPAASERKPFGSRALATTATPPPTVAESTSPTSAPVIILDKSVPIGRPGAVAASVVSILAAAGIALVSVGSLMMSHQGSGLRKSPNQARDDGETGAVSASVGGILDEQAQQHDERRRRPAVTLSFVLVTQLQFLATLSLVDHAVEVEGSLLAEFVGGLRWVNLWWAPDFAEDIGWGECVLAAETGDLGASVFVGNLTLIVIAFISIFFIHVAVISGVQAMWLAKRHAAAPLTVASSRPAPRRQVGSVRFASERTLRRTAPGDPRYRASLDRRGERDGELQPVQEESEYSYGSSDDEGQVSIHSEGGEREKDFTTRNENRLGPVETCREKSQSAWFHFPHVELVFLLFAFEGAVASQVAAMRSASCPEISVTAGVALLLLPVLVLLVVWRVVAVRVHPHALLAFKLFGDDVAMRDQLQGHDISYMSKLKSGWKEGCSLFSWGDKGRWEMIGMEHHAASREHGWFRVGFEPVFVDYTKRGVWFVVVSLIEWATIACIGVLVDASAIQLLLLFLVKVVVFFIIVCYQPFANRIVNTMSASVAAVDGFSAGLLALSTRIWKEDNSVKAAETTVVALQLVLLCALLIPLYLDSVIILVDTVRRNRRRTSSKQNDEDKAARGSVRSYTPRQWCRAWCNMLRHNIVACARDTREGVRRPYHPSARTGPHPALHSEKLSTGADGRPQCLSGSNIGTVKVPVNVLSGAGSVVESGTIDKTSPIDTMSRLEGAPSGRMVIQRGASGRNSEVPSDTSFEQLAITTLVGRDALEGDDSCSDLSAANLMPSATTGSTDSALDRLPCANRPGSFFADKSGNSPPAEKDIPHQRRDDRFIFSNDVNSTTPGRSILARGPSVGALASPTDIERESCDATSLILQSFKRRPSSENQVPRANTPRGGAREAQNRCPDGAPELCSGARSDDGDTRTAYQCPTESSSSPPPSVAPLSSVSGSSPSVSFQLGSGNGGTAVELGAVDCVGGGVKKDQRPSMRLPRVSWRGRDETAESRARHRPRESGTVEDGAAGSSSLLNFPEGQQNDDRDLKPGPDVTVAHEPEPQGAQTHTKDSSRLHATAPWDSAAGSVHSSGKFLHEPPTIVGGETSHADAILAADADESKDRYDRAASNNPSENSRGGESTSNNANGSNIGGDRGRPRRAGSTSFLAGLGVGKREPIQSLLPKRRSKRLTIVESTLPIEIVSPSTDSGATNDHSVREDEDVSHIAMPADDGGDRSNFEGQGAGGRGPTVIRPPAPVEISNQGAGGRGPIVITPPAAVEISNRYANYTFEATPPVRGNESADRDTWRNDSAWADSPVDNKKKRPW